MCIYLVDIELTFTWAIEPTATPLAKADFDVVLKKPDGTQTITEDGITTYTAPTATAQGEVTYVITPDTVGRWQVSLIAGPTSDFTLMAYREIYVVSVPATPVASVIRKAIMNTYGITPEASTNLPVEASTSLPVEDPIYGLDR